MAASYEVAFMNPTKKPFEDVEIDIVIGRKLQLLRFSKGLEVKDLAKKIGISAGRFWRFERGEASLPLVKAIQLCEILNCRLNDLAPNIDAPAADLILTKFMAQTEREGSLLELFRQLPRDKQLAAMHFIDLLMHYKGKRDMRDVLSEENS